MSSNPVLDRVKVFGEVTTEGFKYRPMLMAEDFRIAGAAGIAVKDSSGSSNLQ